MKNEYKFHSDSGHGWLAVPISDLAQIGVLKHVSAYSRMNGQMVYLEEHWDSPLFIAAFIRLKGHAPKINELPTRERSGIRDYPNFRIENVR